MTNFKTFLAGAAKIHEVVDAGDDVRHVMFDNNSGRTLISVWDVEADQQYPTMMSYPSYERALEVFDRDYR